MPTSPQCQSIQDQIVGTIEQRNELQEELRRAAPSEKPALIRMIRALNAEIARLQNQLADCEASNPGDPPPPPPPPPPPDIRAILTGTVRMTTTYDRAPGPYDAPLRLELVINGARTTISLTSFPAIGAGFDTPLGWNQTTVTQTGGGTGVYDRGAIVLPIALHLDHSVDIPLYEEDSDWSLVLSTDPPGSPLSAEPFGHVVLEGSGRFVGGILGDSVGTLRVWGEIAEAVPTIVPDVRETRPVAAAREVKAAGLVSRFTGPNGRNSWVYSQSPSAGSPASRGDTVTMLLKNTPIP